MSIHLLTVPKEEEHELIFTRLCRWKTGNVYVGDWQDGIAHGHGSFSYNIGPRKGEEYKERIQIPLMLSFALIVITKCAEDFECCIRLF